MQSGVTHLGVFIPGIHPMVTLILSDDLARVLDYDLVGFKCSVCSDAVTPVNCLHHFNTNVVFPTLFASLFQISEGAVRAMLCTNIAVRAITFVQHESIKTMFITAVLLFADAQRMFHRLGFFPQVGSIADEHVCTCRISKFNQLKEVR